MKVKQANGRIKRFIIEVKPKYQCKSPPENPKRKTKKWFNDVKNWTINQAKWKYATEWCDNNDNVLEWTSESVIIPYISPFDNKAHRYYVDNKVVIKEGDKIVRYLIEIKPDKQTKKPVTKRSTKKKSTIMYENYTYVINQCKWEAARKWCDKHGYKFLILTEKELF